MPMKKTLSKIRGFTIVELLVTIAIIALLTGIVITSLVPAKGKARDAKRISDIGNIQLALELFFDRCKEYPATITTGATATGCPGGITLDSYISVVPTQPDSSPYSYTTSGSPTLNDYVLMVSLENYNEILKDDLDGTQLGIACGANTDTPEKIYCLGPK